MPTSTAALNRQRKRQRHLWQHTLGVGEPAVSHAHAGTAFAGIASLSTFACRNFRRTPPGVGRPSRSRDRFFLLAMRLAIAGLRNKLRLGHFADRLW